MLWIKAFHIVFVAAGTNQRTRMAGTAGSIPVLLMLATAFPVVLKPF